MELMADGSLPWRIDMNINTKVESMSGEIFLRTRNLRMMALTSAAMIIRECKEWLPDGNGETYPIKKSTVLGILHGNVNWSPHGFINALQSHVELVYAFVESAIDGRLIIISYEEALLLTSALKIFQKWKTEIIKKEQNIYGKEWGTLSGFNQAQWDKNNVDLLAMFKTEV
jgi:hypothetical protein